MAPENKTIKALHRQIWQGTAYLHASSHCHRYELSHCNENPELYVLRIEWVSVEEHLQGFRKEPNFKSFFALVQGYFSNIEEMQHYELTEVLEWAGVAG